VAFRLGLTDGSYRRKTHVSHHGIVEPEPRHPPPPGTTVMLDLQYESHVAVAPLEFEHTQWRRIARAPPTICVRCTSSWLWRFREVLARDCTSRRD